MTVIGALLNTLGNSLALQIACTLAVLLAYPVLAAVRNVYFHPLSKLPGSKWWAASWFPYIHALLTATLVRKQAQMHDKYGDVIRLGPNEVSFATEDAWKDIYDYRPGHKEAVKDDRWYIAPDNAPQNIVTTKDTKVRARMRKHLSNSFTEAALKDQAPLVEGHCDLLISQLRALASSDTQEGAVVDMTDWINFFFVDVMSDLAFGESFGCLQDSRYHPWVQTLFDFLKGMVFAASSRFYPSITLVMKSLIPRSVIEAQEKHAQFANSKVDERIALETERPDFMTPFLKADPKFQHISRGEIQSTFAVTIVAGSETPATVICGMLNQLTTHPEILHKLEREVRSCFASEADITIASTKSVPYMDAVINEALRFCNPVIGGLPRVVPEGGDMYAGHYLPAGTFISIRPFVVARSDKYFRDGSSFVPERWLSNAPQRYANDHLAASKPFGTGPTSCIGKRLAWAKLRLIVARMIWAFDFSVDPGKALDWSKLKVMMTVEKESMPLRIKNAAGALVHK